MELTVFIRRSSLKGLTIKSLIPACTASITIASWPMAEHITTLALLLGPDRLQRLQPIHIRHGDVHEDQVGMELKVFFHCVLSVDRLVDIGIAVLRQGVANDLSHKSCIVYDQNFCHVTSSFSSKFDWLVCPCQLTQLRTLQYFCDSDSKVVVNDHHIAPGHAQPVYKQIHLIPRQFV